MWTREELKIKAKGVLGRSYWKALLVSFILAMVSGRSGNVYQSFNLIRNDRVDLPELNEIINLNPRVFISLIWIAIFIGVTIFVASMVFKVFLGYPLEVGARRFFISLTARDAEVNSLGYSFKNGRYMNIIKTMFYTNILIFLWSLLLIIPGIIKGYAYSMVPYILADNPTIHYKRALELSEQMTRGEKADIWVLDLSFIGWYLLGALACGVGIIFVNPYVNATKAELYITLRKKALKNGLFRYEELNNTSM